MKKLLIPLIAFFFIIGIVQGKSLWQYATFEERAQLAMELQFVKTPIEYEGDLETNLSLLEWYQAQDTFNSQLLNKINFGGDTLLIAGATYNLAGSGVNSSATSFTLQSLTLTQNGYKIQDSDLSKTFYLTLEPGNKTRQEIVSCVTVTQNAAGTATLSGCLRGLSPISPYTASSTLQFAHAGGSQAIFSDPPQVFNEFGRLGNDNTWSGKNVFGTSTVDTITHITLSTTTPARIENNAGTLYYCNYGSSCSVIGAGANTYNFVDPFTVSGSQVALATSSIQAYSWAWSGTNTWSGKSTFANATTTGKIIIGASSWAAPSSTVTIVGGQGGGGDIGLYVIGDVYFSDEIEAKNGFNLSGGQFDAGNGAFYVGINGTATTSKIIDTKELCFNNGAGVTSKCSTSYLSDIATSTASQALGTSDGNLTYKEVDCPSGYAVTGGGYTVPNTAAYVSNQNYPIDPNTWAVQVICDTTIGTCSAGNLTVTAICAKN